MGTNIYGPKGSNHYRKMSGGKRLLYFLGGVFMVWLGFAGLTSGNAGDLWWLALLLMAGGGGAVYQSVQTYEKLS